LALGRSGCDKPIFRQIGDVERRNDDFLWNINGGVNESRRDVTGPRVHHKFEKSQSKGRSGVHDGYAYGVPAAPVQSSAFAGKRGRLAFVLERANNAHRLTEDAVLNATDDLFDLASAYVGVE